MYITVSYKDGFNENIIQIDRRQEIGAGLKILQETGRSKYQGSPDFFLSKQLMKTVSAYCTFEESEIYSGDDLMPVDKEGR